MASIGDLTDDLLSHCLSFCGRRGVASASLVCQRWAEVCRGESLWYAVLSREEGWDDLKFAECVLAHAPTPTLLPRLPLVQQSPQSQSLTQSLTQLLSQLPSAVLPQSHLNSQSQSQSQAQPTSQAHSQSQGVGGHLADASANEGEGPLPSTSQSQAEAQSQIQPQSEAQAHVPPQEQAQSQSQSQSQAQPQSQAQSQSQSQALSQAAAQVLQLQSQGSGSAPLSGVPSACHRGPSNELTLPWPTIMRQRHALPRAVIIDAGSGYCKFGWSSLASPSDCLATFLEFGSLEPPLLPRINTLFKTVFSTLDADPRDQPVIVTEPLCHLEDTKSAVLAREELREATCGALFNRFRVPSICFISQAHLALYAARRISGIVVNIGFKLTTILPIVRGRKLPGGFGVEVVPVAAMRVTGSLHYLMQFSGIECQDMFTIRTLKEKLCYVSPELRDFPSTAAQQDSSERHWRGSATYRVHEEQGGGTYTLGPQRFLAPEVLFNPHIFGLPARSIQDGVRSSIQRCASLLADLEARDKGQQRGGQGGGAGADDSGEAGAGAGEDKYADVSAEDLREAMRNVVLCGGTASIPGLDERLLSELKRSLPADLSTDLVVHPNPHGYDCPFMGAKLLAQMSVFPGSWCLSREQYRSEGCRAASDLALDVRLRLRR